MTKRLMSFALLSIAAVSSLSVAGTRQQAAEAAKKLTDIAAVVSDHANFRGYPNTAQRVGNIAQTAKETQNTALTGTRADTEDLVNDIVDQYTDPNFRQFVRNIPSATNRLRIKRLLKTAINELGAAVFGPAFIPVAAPAAGGAPADDEDWLEAVHKGTPSGQNWD